MELRPPFGINGAMGFHLSLCNAAVFGSMNLSEAEYREHGTIDVNLRRTRTIRTSGMAMLLMLQRLTGWESSRIRLLNCNPEIRKQLKRSPVGQQFQVV
jgi:hypothetical protein